MQMRLHILSFLLVGLAANAIGQNDTVAAEGQSFKRFSYGISGGGLFIPKVKEYMGDGLVYSRPTIGYSVNLSISYNFNNKWALSTGIGFYTGGDYYETDGRFWIDPDDTTTIVIYGINRHEAKEVNYNIPLFVTYTLKPTSRLKYFVKSGVQFEMSHGTSVKRSFKSDDFYYEFPETSSTASPFRKKDKFPYVQDVAEKRISWMVADAGVQYELTKRLRLSLSVYLLLVNATTIRGNPYGTYYIVGRERYGVNLGIML